MGPHLVAVSPILRLPREVLEIIVDNVDLNTQLSLSRISKIFHTCSVSSIYRVVCLNSPSSIIKCCHTLIRRRVAALSVRSFTIRYMPIIRPIIHYFASFYDIIQRALARMLHLQELNLMVPDPGYVRLLNHTSFHSLSHFECHLPLTQALIIFLNLHPTIVYLQVASTERVIENRIQPQVVLPRLQYFIGNSEYVPALVPNASLRAAFIVWETADGTPLDTIKSLEQSSGGTINLVSCRRSGWNLDLIDLISTWLPDIYVLIITNILTSNTRPSDTYLSDVASKLSRFTTLRQIHLHCIETENVGSITCNLDDDFKTVTTWGAACQSLTQCILPYSNGMKWVRFRKYDLWIPDSDDPPYADWTWKMLHSDRDEHPVRNRVLPLIVRSTQEDTLVALRSLLREEVAEG